MPPILCVVGRSGSGKTTLMEKLVGELNKRGYRVAAVKHAHERLDIDRSGKDSWRFSQAGSEVVAAVSPHEMVIIKRTERDLALEEVSRRLPWDYDLLLAEGFKESDYPRIEVHGKATGTGLLSLRRQVLAVATDEQLDTEAPQFSRDDVKGVADVIEKWLKRQAGAVELEVSVGDSQVALDSAAEDLLVRTIMAAVGGPGDVEKAVTVRITLRRNT